MGYYAKQTTFVRDEREGVPVSWSAVWLTLAIVVGFIVHLLDHRAG